ncbi:MAG: hypothetical protein ACE5Z5_07265 [Candidatus Bathyarchaeia archaeon]
MAKREGVDRNAFLRRVAELGLQELLLADALEAYRQVLVSAWKVFNNRH